MLLHTDIKAVFDNLTSEKPKNNFTLGIVDDVTNTSLVKIRINKNSYIQEQ